MVASGAISNSAAKQVLARLMADGGDPHAAASAAGLLQESDGEALEAFHTLCRIEGIIPALESSHALAYAAKLAPTLGKDKILLVNLSGRGDKDMHTVAEKSGIVF